MREIIEWQRDAEILARDVYKSLADAFRDDVAFSGFLQKLSVDENGHAKIMNSALELFEKQGAFPKADLLLDEQTRQNVLTPIEACRREVASGAPNKERVLDAIIWAEFSEWNDIFVYILQSCQQYDPKFQKMASAIQKHKQRIEEYLSKAGLDQSGLSGLPEVWQARFLVVDDEPIIRLFMEQVLSSHAQVEAAENGVEALAKTEDGFYDLIISDVDMPEMNGMAFFSKLVERDPDVAKRFVFCSGNESAELVTFCEENKITNFLEKPFPLHELNGMVKAIMEKE